MSAHFEVLRLERSGTRVDLLWKPEMIARVAELIICNETV